jgi:hypothetical protein
VSSLSSSTAPHPLGWADLVERPPGRLHVRDEVGPGMVLVPRQRSNTAAAADSVNLLCAESFTDIGAGATYQGTWLDVRSE